MKKVFQYNQRISMLLIFILGNINLYSQTDSTSSDLKFDFGITRSRNINLWPIFKKFKNTEKTELDILYPLFSKNIELNPRYKHFQFLPLLISDSSTDIDKRFISTYYPSVFHYQKKNLIHSSIQSYRFFELAPNISCLGLSRSSNGLFVENNMFFFIWYKKDTVNNATRLIVFPTYWYYLNTKDTTQIFFPFYSSHKTKTSKSFHVGLIYSQKESNTFHSKSLFPLYWNKTSFNAKDTETSTTLFPIYWSFKDHYTDNKVLFPILFYKNNLNYHSLSVLPVFSIGHSPDLNEQHLNIYPLYWQKKNQSFSRNILFPIWWNIKNYSLTDTSYQRTIFPIYWSFINKDNQSTVIPPILFSFKNRTYQSLTLFPLFSRGHSADNSEKHFDILPLYWQVQNKLFAKQILFPLWWNIHDFQSSDTIIHKTLFPIYWSQKSKYINNIILFPLVYRFIDREKYSCTLLPIFSMGHSIDFKEKYLYIFPLYSHKSNPEYSKTVLFPFWWYRKDFSVYDTSVKQVFFPLYWTKKNMYQNNKILFPLVYRIKGKEKESFTLFPLYSFGRNIYTNQRFLAITPLYWHIHDSHFIKDVVFPIYWRSINFGAKDSTVKNTLFPVYWSYKNDQINNKIIFPFVFRLNNASYHSLTVLPLFSSGHSLKDNSRHFDILPFYWHYKSNENSATVIFPLWWNFINRSPIDTANFKTLFPLYWSFNGNHINNKIFLPFVYSFKSESYNSFSILPLFSFGHDSNYTRQQLTIFPFYWHRKNQAFAHSILFPLWWSKTFYSANDTTYNKTLFPIYWSVKNKEKNDKVIFPLIYQFNDRLNQSFTVFPFYSKSYSREEKLSQLSITPFYWHLTSPSFVKSVLIPFWWSKKTYSATDTTFDKTLFPIYWSIKNKERNNKVIFPLIYQFNDRLNQSVTVFPFYSKSYSREEMLSQLSITPFYWHLTSPKYVKSVLIPFWWSKKTYSASDTTFNKTIFPIYWSVKNKERNDKVIFPFVYRFKSNTYQSFTLFPLYSHGYARDLSHQYTALSPFFWSAKDRKSSMSFLFPLYLRTVQYDSNDIKIKNIIYPIYWSNKSNGYNNKILFPLVFKFENSRSFSFTIFPFLSFGHSINKEHKYVLLTPFIGYFKNPKSVQHYAFPLYSYKQTSEETNRNFLWFFYRNTTRKNYLKTSVIWPICEYLRYPNYRSFRVAPIVWYKHTDTSHMFSIQPFYYSYKSVSRKTKILAWFLYKHERINNIQNSTQLLWKAYTNDRYANGDYETRFLYLVYANVKKQGKYEQSILPIYYKVQHANGDKSKSIFFGFYNYFKQYKADIKESYEEERIFWFIRLRSNYAKLKSEGKEMYMKRR